MQYQFNEDIDGVDVEADPLAILLAAEEDGEFIFHYEVPADRELH